MSSWSSRASRRSFIASFSVILLAWASWAQAGPVRYTVVDLGTGVASGVSAGQQVGNDVNQNLALLWTGSAASRVILGSDAMATGVSKGRQAGSLAGHATIWNGTPQSAIDLNPAGFSTSQALGIGDGQVVGFGHPIAGGVQHALLWNGFSAASAVDLSPPNFSPTEANAVSGGFQIGFGATSGTPESHPLLWHGSADSASDITPDAFIAQLKLVHAQAEANGIDANTRQIVGSINGILPDGERLAHAIIWTDLSPDHIVDLHPSGKNFAVTVAYAVSGGQEVGSAILEGSTDLHALVWSGTADSVIDLHQFLPADATGSVATAIDSEGNIAGYDLLSDGTNHALLWIPSSSAIPLPPALFPALMVMAAMCCQVIRKRKGTA